MPTARSPVAALSIGTTSASKKSANGSGRRRPRVFVGDGTTWLALSIKYPVAVLNDAFAAEVAAPLVCLAFM